MDASFWNDQKYRRLLQITDDFYTHSGKIEKIAGMTMEASGLAATSAISVK